MARPEKTKAWCVYLVECADRSLYCGATNDIDGRIKTHNAGRGGKYTRPRLPVRLVYFEESPSKTAALRREAEIKRMNRRQKLNLCRFNSRELVARYPEGLPRGTSQ